MLHCLETHLNIDRHFLGNELHIKYNNNLAKYQHDGVYSTAVQGTVCVSVIQL